MDYYDIQAKKKKKIMVVWIGANGGIGQNDWILGIF